MVAIFAFFFFWPCLEAYGILVPQAGIKSTPLAMREQRPNHWAPREFP